MIVFYADHLPDRTHHDALLAYMKYKFDAIVESDYSIVYFHFGLNSGVRVEG